MIHGDWLSHSRRLVPHKEALVPLQGGPALTYLALSQRVEKAAGMLQKHMAVAPGDRVAAVGANRVEQVELMLACGKLGAVFLPLNWRLTPPEVAWLLADAQPKVLFFSKDSEHLAVSVEGSSACSCQRVSLEDQPGGYPELRDGAPPEPLSPPHLTDASPWLLLYTSGTTGHPKGAVLTHGSLTWNALNTLLGWDLHRDDVTLTHTPLFHTGGWNVLTLPLLYLGGTVVLADRFDPRAVLDAVSSHRITWLFAVPTMWQMILDAAPGGLGALSPLRRAISGGAPCPAPLIQSFRHQGIPFVEGYGLTEVGPNCFTFPEDAIDRKPGSVGVPMPFLETCLVDEGGNPVPVGEVGELWLRGPTVCGGYLGNPAATEATFRPQGWFATGDLFSKDSDGFHTVVGRRKDMFISGGENVYPAEVERVLLALPGIVEAAVVGVPDPRWGEVGHAFLGGPGAEALTEARVLEGCRASLARYKIPKGATLLPSLPKNSTGKIDKKNLALKARGITP